jgi:hypothetical protein
MHSVLCEGEYMKNIFWLLLVYCLLCCTACQKVPDEVDQDVEAYKKSDESKIDSKLVKKAPIEEIKSTLNQYNGEQFGQLIMPEDIIFPEVTSVYTLDLSEHIDYTKIIGEVASILWKDLSSLQKGEYKVDEFRDDTHHI